MEAEYQRRRSSRIITSQPISNRESISNINRVSIPRLSFGSKKSNVDIIDEQQEFQPPFNTKRPSDN